MNNIYRYQLDRYRGRATRYVSPQCGRKYTFTIYIDTTNNSYINDKVGKNNLIDKCGYHYINQYIEYTPWLREIFFFSKHRVFEKKKENAPTHANTLRITLG